MSNILALMFGKENWTNVVLVAGALLLRKMGAQEGSKTENVAFI